MTESALQLFQLPESSPLDAEAAAAEKVNFFDFSRHALIEFLKERFNESEYRAVQLFEWVYKKGETDVLKMTNISRALREKLHETFLFPTLQVKDRQISKDGTRKYLFDLGNGEFVESVMIKQPNRMTLCVSSQVGCGMGCKFCRTATMGFRRNLTTGEIIGQVRGVIEDAKQFDDMFNNIVFMGMGEPLHNFKGVTEAVKILREHFGFSIPGRKITVSTVGLVPAIKKFGALNLDVSLAVSLNATTDEVRSKIMPVNRKFPLEELIKAIREFPLTRRKRITIEYVMLDGVNCADSDLRRLGKMLRGLKVKVNLIPYNVNAGLGFTPPKREKIARWQRDLVDKGIQTTVRWSKGADIKAACGQLAVENAG